MNLCKKIGKSIAIAFSMYSKIPMVQFEWKEEDMRYSMCFFPLVGIVIGLLSWCWWLFCQHWKNVFCICWPGNHSFGDRRYSYGWLYGYDGCASFLWKPREKARNLKGFSYWCICRDYDCSLCADSSRCIF